MMSMWRKRLRNYLYKERQRERKALKHFSYHYSDDELTVIAFFRILRRLHLSRRQNADVLAGILTRFDCDVVIRRFGDAEIAKRSSSTLRERNRFILSA